MAKPLTAVYNVAADAIDTVVDTVKDVLDGPDKKPAPAKPKETGGSTTASTSSAGSATSSTDVSKAVATALAEARRAETQAMAEARREEARLNAETKRLEAIERADTARRESDNMLRAEKDQNMTMRWGIMKNSQDTQFQILAWLTGQLEGLDTKNQIFMKDAEVRLAQIGSDYDIRKRELRLEEHELDFREHEIDRVRMLGSDGLLSS